MDDPRVLIAEDTYLERYTISDAEIVSAAELREHLQAVAESEYTSERQAMRSIRLKALIVPVPPASKVRAPVSPDAPFFRRGMLGYATILALVKRKPRVATEIAAILEIREVSPRVILRQLHHLGVVHIAGWARVGKKGPRSAVWAAGFGVDVPPPPPSEGLTSTNKSMLPPRVCIEAITFASVIKELAEPISARSLAAAVGIVEHTSYRLLAHMRKLRLIHVAFWDSTVAAMPVPMFALGRRLDAERPQPQSREQIWRRHEERRSARNQMRNLIHRTAAPRAEVLST